MNTCRTILSIIAVAGVTALTGCAGFDGAAFPASSASPVNASNELGGFQGSVYGGHAPLAGAHLYVLQPGITGYGSQATSLLTGSAATCNGSANQICQNSTDPGGVPTSWYYMQTDNNGAYNISGDYTCVKGLPVYLYAFGGTPTFPSTNPSLPLATAAGAQTAVSDGTHILYTYTTTAVENYYIGEPVAITNFNSASSGFNQSGNVADPGNASQTVTYNGTTYKPTLTTTQFSVYTTNNIAGTYSDASQVGVSPAPQVASTPGFNASVVNLAVLGVCPSSGNFSTGGTLYDQSTFKPLTYVYMNEVSTAAAAYAFQGFTVAPTATNVSTGINIGTSNTNSHSITDSTGTYTAYTGIDVAARNAGQLYDIQGSSITTSYAGEGHIARTVTPYGNGYTPQATLDTIGNILAACVDSNNTGAFNSTTYQGGTFSPQCTELLQTAESNGIPTGNTGAGYVAEDTATAAFNMARYPAGNPSYTTFFMNELYALPTGNVPFTPHLTAQPTDFTVSIVYPNTSGTNGTTVGNPFVSSPENITIDNFGNIIGTGLVTGTNTWLYQISPLGVPLYQYNNTAYGYGYVTVDATTNEVVMGSNPNSNPKSIVHLTGSNANTGSYASLCTASCTAPTQLTATNYYGTYSLQKNSAGTVLFPGSTTANAVNYLYTIASGATTAAIANTAPFTNGTSGEGSHTAVDGAGFFWVSMESAGFDIGRFSATGASGGTGAFAINNIQSGGNGDAPENIGLDISYTGWVPMQNSSRLMMLALNASSPYYAQTFYTSGTTKTSTTVGASFYSPFGSEVDGNNIDWITNRGNTGSGSNGGGSASGSLVALSTATITAVSPPTTNYAPAGLNGPLNLVIDQSGSIWIANYAGGANGSITEVIGSAAPSTPHAKQTPGRKP